jgi:hypothetical protein
MADRISDEKVRTSLSITKECSALMSALAKKKGVSRNAVIELSVRLLAEAEGVTTGKEAK